MRPDRFTQLLLTAARSLPDTTAEPVAEDRKKRPYLVAVTAGGKTSRWQVVAASAPGDRYDEPAWEPVVGEKAEPPAAMAMPAGGPEQLEHALVAAVLEADSGEIAGVDLYSQRVRLSDSGAEIPDPPAVGYGATIVFHDGSRIYLNRAR